jgi:hypothetical protein
MTSSLTSLLTLPAFFVLTSFAPFLMHWLASLLYTVTSSKWNSIGFVVPCPIGVTLIVLNKINWHSASPIFPAKVAPILRLFNGSVNIDRRGTVNSGPTQDRLGIDDRRGGSIAHIDLTKHPGRKFSAHSRVKKHL